MIWIWLVAILLLIGIWVGGYFLAWALWLKILLTVAVVLIIASAYLWRRVRAVMKARALEREILKQAEQQAMNARPDRRAEIIELQMQVRRGLEALRASKLGSRGGSALYSLPWYVMIGPPGAGKTTALKHSGLVFPFLDPQGGGVRGVGGTRNCDWWFTNEGILLDTAGRYTTEADDHEEWIAFLGMLRKYRSRKPINGVLVAISITEIAEASEETIDAVAKRLRARIDEVMTRLDMVVPVYVMFTKADLVSGFVEFWSDLRKSERAQIFGATFNVGNADTVDASKAFEGEFDRLVATIHARAIRRISAERQLVNRQKIFHFPLEYQALRNNLSDFVGALFQKNSFQETPIFRGVYFSSGTQEGRPVDRVIGGMMRAFNMAPPSANAPATPTEQKSYFVADMFRRVVFPDQHFAGRTKGELRRQLISRIAFAASALLVAAMLVLPSSCTFSHNRDLVRSTEDIAVAAGKVNWNDHSQDILTKVKALDDIGTQLRQLDTWKQEGAPLSYRWGMYVGNELYEPVRSVYVSNLQVAFAIPTKARLEDELRGVGDPPSFTTEQYNTYFNRLKAYLEACDIERLDLAWEPAALTDGWARALGTSAKSDKDVLRPHAQYYVELMKRKEIAPWKCDMDLVTRMRSVLRRVSAADRDYSALIRDANENVAPITRDTIFLNTAFGTFITSKSKPEVIVVGAYTRIGWESYVRDRLGKDRAKQLAQERWVLGENEATSIEETSKHFAELRDRYFANYTRAWSDFIKDLDVRQPQSNEEALDELSALSEVPWPYLKLFKTLEDNVKLQESTTEKAGGLVQGLVEGKLKENAAISALADSGLFDASGPPAKWISPPESAFDPIVKFAISGAAKEGEKPPPTALGHYQDQIVSKLVGVLTDLRDSKNRGVEPKDVTKAFEEAIRNTNEILTPTQSGFTRPILSPLLLNPIQLGYAGVLNTQGGATGGRWEEDVWQKWHDLLQDDYPFTDSTTDAKLTDFTEFFKPKSGLLFGFYEKNLTGSLDKRGLHYVPSTRFGHSAGYTGAFLKCYDRGAEIAEAAFGPKPDSPVVEFEINLHSVSENIASVAFEIDGATRTYKNEPEEWLKVQWPAKEPTVRGGKVRVRGQNNLDEEINRPGDFGFFRMLDATSKIEAADGANKRGNGAQALVVTWKLRTQPGFVKMDIRSSKDASVFVNYLTKHERIFRGYDCPRLITTGVR